MKGILYLNQIGEVADCLDKTVIDYINEGQIETFESFPSFNIIAFDWYDIYNIDAEPSQILIYIDKDDIFFFCENETSYCKVQKIFKDTGTNERTLYTFFVSLLKGDSRYSEKFEDRIAALEDAIMCGARRECSEEIMAFRKELLRLKKYYEQLSEIFEELVENENDIISSERLRYFVILESRIGRLHAGVMHLREYITQVREAYQAQIDIEQNKLMKVFTVITSIFLPLTLLVGWYGMNFPMPEFEWPYGYAVVCTVSIIIFFGGILLFKKKKWF